ncbi:MAG: electron transport complex subunit RsxC [Deltaproteobacteria bacterium]|nr:electron transport complex subunit RsxC [Deltaproteobacteria bacterium]
MPKFRRAYKSNKEIGWFPGNGTFDRGVHPPERKTFSGDAAIEIVPTPEKVVLPLLQHIGGPCTPVVKPKQEVLFGDRVGKGEAFVSASLHAPLNGIVQKMEVATLANGRHVQAIAIRSHGEQTSGQDLWDQMYGGKWPQKTYQAMDPEKISAAIHDAGIVGLGGAAFPTHVKISPNEKKPIHTLIVNGCECEPYLTTDYRLMVEAPEAIVAGAMLALRAVGAKKAYIGVEDNKVEAIASLRRTAAGAGINIAILKTKYPQGSEKHLIKAVLNREVPLGGLPSDIGVAMTNVATVTSIARAVMRRIPLTHRVVSVTGGGIAQPKNLLVPIGISMGALIEFCGGLRKTAARMVAGGPMMGFSFSNLNMPVTKGTSGITVLTHAEIRRVDQTVCIRCGRCVDVCPMNLVPTKLAMASRLQELNVARTYNIMACFECGSCAHICPAGLPLVQLIRTGKAMLAKEAA